MNKCIKSLSDIQFSCLLNGKNNAYAVVWIDESIHIANKGIIDT